MAPGFCTARALRTSLSYCIANSIRSRPMSDEQPVVFIIDDDASVRDAVTDLLRSVGLGAESFGSTQEFLQSTRPDAPACIVLDVRLPGPSGLEFQRMLINSSIHLPIIFISGHGDIPMSVRAMKSGAVEFLTKPLHEQELLDAVQAGIERDRARRQEAKVVAELQERFDSLTPRERASLDARHFGLPEQADCRSGQIERDDGEGSSQPNHAKDASEVFGRPGANGRQARRFHQKVVSHLNQSTTGLIPTA